MLYIKDQYYNIKPKIFLNIKYNLNYKSATII